MFQMSKTILIRTYKIGLASATALQLVACNPMDAANLNSADQANNTNNQVNELQSDRDRQKTVNLASSLAVAKANAELIAGLTKNIILRSEKKEPEQQRTVSCAFGGSIVVNLKTFGAKFDGCKLKDKIAVTGELVHSTTEPFTSFQPEFYDWSGGAKTLFFIEATASRSVNGNLQVTLPSGTTPCAYKVFISSDATGQYDVNERGGELLVYQWMRGSMCGTDVDPTTSDMSDDPIHTEL